MELPELLRQIRRSLELSQEAISKQVGVTQTYWSYLETGKRRNPSPNFLDELQKLLGHNDPLRETIEKFKTTTGKKDQDTLRLQAIAPLTIAVHGSTVTVKKNEGNKNKPKNDWFELHIYRTGPVTIQVNSGKITICFY
jgi:transcriptional regulator with XRE-family HTH domain